MVCAVHHYSCNLTAAISQPYVAYGGLVRRIIGTTRVNLTHGTLQFHVVDTKVKTLLGLVDSVKLDCEAQTRNAFSRLGGPRTLIVQRDV